MVLGAVLVLSHDVPPHAVIMNDLEGARWVAVPMF